MTPRMFLLFFLTLFTLCLYVFPQPIPIGPGWAQNSVNAVVFRKNSVVTHHGKQYVAYYDSSGYVVLARREIGTENWKTEQTQHTGEITDAHCSISIMVDGDGYLHMAWNHHNNSLHYCKSIAPDTLKLTEELDMIGTEEDDVTYPEFFKLPTGDLIFLYRHGGSGNGNLAINRYKVSEKSWERLHDVLIDGEGNRNAYWQSCVDSMGTIHISWVWRETWDVATNHDMCYARSTDFGVTWYKSTGEQYAIPITAATAEYIADIPQGKELINQTSMYADTDGRPYIATYFEPAGSSIPQYHLLFHDGNEWITRQITNRTTPFSLSGEGTKKIPVSRPQIVVDNRNEDRKVFLVYRDEERNSKVSINVSIDLEENTWEVYDLTGFSVESWEPSYDTELWKDSLILHVFVQKVAQGDSESLEDMPAQPVCIYEMSSDLQSSETIVVVPFE